VVALNVMPGAPFEAVIDAGASGLDATIGFEVNDNIGNAVLAFRGGALALAPTVYSIAGGNAPLVSGQYTIIWRDALGGNVLGVEGLTVAVVQVAIVPGPPVGASGHSGSELITEFLADKRFGTSRTRVLGFLNYRYGELLMLEEWAFLQGQTLLTLDAAQVQGPVDMGLPWSLSLSDDGTPLAQLTPSAWQELFLGDSTPGRPAAFAVYSTSLLIGPQPDAAYPATLLYQIQPPPIADDSVPPVLPPEAQLALVAGAQAFALELENDPTGAPLEARYQRTIDAMRRRYLVTGRGLEQQMPRDPVLQ
jgi:hypothetical protein